MHQPHEISASLDRVAADHAAANLRTDVRQLAAKMATATVDSELAAELLEMAGRIMRNEEIQLGREVKDALDVDDEAAAAAYTIGRHYAYSLAQCRLPRAAEQARRIHAIYRDPDAFLAWEKETLG